MQIQKTLIAYIQKYKNGQLFRGSFIFFIMKMGAMFFGYVNMWIISKFFGSEALGIFSFVLSVVTFAAIFAKLGTDMATVKMVSKFLAKKQYGKIKHFYLQVSKIILPGTLLIASILFFMNETIAINIFDKPHYAFYLRIAAIMIIPTAFVQINAEVHRAFNKIIHYAFFNLYSTFITLIVLVIILLFTNNTDIYIPIATHAGSTLLLTAASFVSIYFLWRKMKGFRKEPVPTKEIRKIAMPMYQIAIAGTTILWADKLLLGAMVPDSEIGIYHLMTRIATLLSLVLLSANTVLAPKFSELWELKETLKLRQLIYNSTKAITLTTLPILLLIIIFAYPISSFFGEEFGAGAHVLIILCIAQFVDVWTGPVGIFLLMTGHEKFNRNISIASTILFLFAAYSGIKLFGITGAAMTILLIYIFRNFVYVIYIKKKFGINFLYIPLTSRRSSNQKQQ